MRNDLTITCWGRIHRFFDPPPGEFIAIGAGSRHACGIRTDNTIDCWGYNSVGQASPPDGKFIAMATGWQHSCGVRADQSIACWGHTKTIPPPNDVRFVP